MSTYTVSLSSSQNPVRPCHNVIFTASVTATLPVTSGYVVFYNGHDSEATQPIAVNGAGQATFCTKYSNSCRTRTVTAYYFPQTTLYSGTLVQNICKH